jgi:hypothetical protein
MAGELLVGSTRRCTRRPARARKSSAQRRFAIAFGHARLGFEHLLADQAAGEVDVDVVLEIDADEGQPEQRHGADFLDAGQAGHGRFDREGQQLLDVLGGEARRLGIDVDLDRRHIRKGIHRHGAERLHAEDHDEQESHQDQDLVAQRNIDN